MFLRWTQAIVCKISKKTKTWMVYGASIILVSFSRWNDGTFDVNPVSLGSKQVITSKSLVGILVIQNSLACDGFKVSR